MRGSRHVARTCLVVDWEVDELDFGHRSAVGGTGRRCIRVGECDQLSYGGETGTVRFSVDWRLVRGSRHVATGCLVADQGDDQCGLGHRCTVDGFDRLCFDDGKGNALGYGGESGTVGFSVFRRVGRGSRHVGYGCLVADWEVDEFGFGHGSTVVDGDR